MGHIIWINVNEKRVTDNQIKQLEQYLNIKFPNDFIECVQKYDGGYPTPDTFNIPNQDENSLSPTIVFWDHEKEDIEEAIHPVCSTFTELLASLRELEEED